MNFIFYSFFALLGWGILNYLVSLFSQKNDTFKVGFLIQFFGFVFTLVLAPWFFVFPFSFQNLVPLFFPGTIAGLAYLSMIRALQEGLLSIVSPIVSLSPFITAILSFVFLKEPLTPLKILGLVSAFLGVVLLGINLQKIFQEKRVSLLKGVKWAIITAIGWGISFFLLARFSQNLGWYNANLSFRFWIAITFIVLAFVLKKEPKVLFKNISPLLGAIVLIDVFSTLSFNIGLVKGSPGIVSTISGNSPLITVILARIFLKEKLRVSQKLGIVFSLLGIIVLSFFN